MYVFEKDAGGAGTRGQAVILSASDLANRSNFGWSVACSRKTVVVGAPDADPSGYISSGQAYVFEPSLMASFSAMPTTGAAPLAVTFSDTSAGRITGWLWDFGDGLTATDQDPVHTYTGPGLYSVILTISGPDGTDIIEKTNYITVGTKPPLFADFTVSPVSGTAPLTVKCSDQSVGSPTRYNYNFGDGTNMTGPNPVHTFRLPGIYDITLTITKFDKKSGSMISSSITKKNVVTVSNVQFTSPVADFTAVSGKRNSTIGGQFHR